MDESGSQILSIALSLPVLHGRRKKPFTLCLSDRPGLDRQDALAETFTLLLVGKSLEQMRRQRARPRAGSGDQPPIWSAEPETWPSICGERQVSGEKPSRPTMSFSRFTRNQDVAPTWLHGRARQRSEEGRPTYRRQSSGTSRTDHAAADGPRPT